MMKRLFAIVLSVLFAVPAFAGEAASESKKDLSLIAEVFDYGQDIIAAVIDLGEGNIADTADLSAADFEVTALNTFGDQTVYEGLRNVTDVYASDEPAVIEGEKPAAGRYIIVELQHGFNPADPSANNGATALSSSKQMDLQYQIAVAGGAAEGIHVRRSDAYDEYVDQLVVKDFTRCFTADGLCYYIYIPETEPGEKLPIILWLHGGGERAYSVENEDVFDGAPIRANQGGVGWVNAMNENPAYKAIVIAGQSNSDCAWSWNGVGDDKSNHRDDARIDGLLKEVIASYPDLADTNRIYISGCSNGGAQTISSLIYACSNEDAVKIAAAMPCCPSLSYVQRTRGRRKITDEEIMAIKDTPIWFFNAMTDGTVEYLYTAGTARHLQGTNEAGDIRLTLYPKLEGNGLDGEGEYPGHWSWTMLLGNNGYGLGYDDYATPFDWLFAQTLGD